MGTDEHTQMQELARRVILLEKLVLRQQSRMDELIRRIESLESGEVCAKFAAQSAASDPAASEEAGDAYAAASVADLLDEELKRDLARAYGAEQPPETAQESVQDSLTSAMARAAGSYARATAGKEPVQSDRAKQNEATRQKTAEAAALAQMPTPELREKTPAERTADYIADYNALYDVQGTMFQKKKAQDDFIKQYEVQGMRCTNMQLRLSRPELEPRFVAVTPPRDADYWGMPLGNNLFAVVPNPFLIYGEEMHTAGGMREAFQSNYRPGSVYGRFTVKETATFQFGTIGKVFRRGQIEAEV